VVLIDLGCEKKPTWAAVERYLLKREKSFNKPVAKIGIQEVGGTQAAIAQGLKEVERMLPENQSHNPRGSPGQRDRFGC
jgi:altronate dehydratase